ncbi:hypothetical protein Q7C30_000225 [Pseudomonas sp. RAC1]|uniref:hypothetical protein n=1 Tax=Pseudomonas sp. RAC1 TaxID=3064900 RepID=UPI002721C972|nr:hypothetical protein [Pseudomonas sp. RAC1]MDV9030529.1 hypothetical protein [Pseudomonas sp. RAC1]
MANAKEINFLELGGKLAGVLGFLAFLAYGCGYARLFMIYKSLGCLWVLPFHSFQDVAYEGVMSIFIISVIALPLVFSYRRAVDADNAGRKIVGMVLIGLIAAVGLAHLLGYRFDYRLHDLIIYLCWYGFLGVAAAGTALHSIDYKTYKYLPPMIGAFLVSAIFAGYQLYGDESFQSLNDKGRFKLVESNSGEHAALISAVSGKFLVRWCGTDGSYRLISNTDEWAVSRSRQDACQ